MKSRLSLPFSSPAILAVIMATATQLTAADLTWNGDNNSNWFNTLNWDPQQVPGSEDVAFLTTGTPQAEIATSTIVGNLQILGGQVHLSPSAELNTPNFVLSFNGQIHGEGTHNITQSGNWFGGMIGSEALIPVLALGDGAPSPMSTGLTTVTSGATLNISDDTQDKFLGYRTLSNLSIVQQNAPIQTDNALIINYGTWSMGAHDANIGDDFDSSLFINNGTILMTATGQSHIEPYISQNSQIQVLDGSIVLSGGGDFGPDSETKIISLTPIPPPDMLLAMDSSYQSLEFRYASYVFEPGSLLANPSSSGIIHFTQESGTTIQGTYDNKGITRVDNYATLDIQSDEVRLGYLELSMGSVQTSETTYLTGGQWASGNLLGPDPVVEALAVGDSIIPMPLTTGTFVNQQSENYSPLFLEDGGQQNMFNIEFRNEQLVYQTETTLSLYDSIIHNLGTWYMTGASELHSGTSTAAFVNLGDFISYSNNMLGDGETASASSTASIAVPFLNQGTFTAYGDLVLASPYYQQNGETAAEFIISEGSTVIFAQGADIEGGSLTGSGTLAGPMSISNTTISPFSSYGVGEATMLGDGYYYGGTLNFENNITLAPTTTLAINIYGADTGYYDQILAGGNFDLNQAILKIKGPSDIAEYLTSSDYFAIIDTYGSGQVIGMFAGIADGGLVGIFDYDNALLGHFNLFYNDFQVGLTNFEAIPEPSTWILMILGGGLLAYYLRRRNLLA